MRLPFATDESPRRDEPRAPWAARLVAGGGAMAVIVAMYQLIIGQRYMSGLGWVDASTLGMVGGIALTIARQRRTEPAVALFGFTGLVLSGFLFGFEAIYKFWFFGWVVDGQERRELVLHLLSCSGLLWLTARDDIDWNRRSARTALWTAFAGFGLWLAIGYPQLFPMAPAAPIRLGGLVIDGFPRLLPIDLSLQGVWVLNRLVKLAWAIAVAAAIRRP